MRRGEHVPKAFEAPVDVHASADGQVYMFNRMANETAMSSDEEELGLMEMRPQARHTQKRDRQRNIHLLELEVSDGDNLNKLALQYGCKVADIKRVNNLIQEQDVFALKSIKIPVPRHSFLTETYTNLSDAQEETPHSPCRLPYRHEVTNFLIEVDNDIEKLIQTTDDHDMDVLEDKPKRLGLRGRRLKGYSADWGIQWWNAVIAMLLIGIILPLFYIIYFKTKPSGGTAPLDGSILSSIMSNSSGTAFGTSGPGHTQEPG
ncbi:lysM and putative peptidoglycan-binding domain-containing protein 4 [Dunckerocampus dactyliophorus]|uniref:lysM and putative peptidoglycan-binding domain-containing protein 4 n=1 Tax=Dunckerocampus dactyliophorus TaxID=161453 RepID=UPI0024073764|nr:lysM and putative peptidoglycan-binding domain-containing protein 4 [Dunckerocampus dactyliophorus]XP_054632579.1 lysM and putative peptidoglycan-binding domain-containing protein 4 [Dunckerocampus dactyliophorus]